MFITLREDVFETGKGAIRREFDGLTGVQIGIQQRYKIPCRRTIQCNQQETLINDKKRGFGVCIAFAEPPCGGF